MDSIGDVLKQMGGSRIRQRTEDLKTKILNEPEVRQLRLRYPELAEQELTRNLSRLYEFVKEKKHCDNCPGLENCPNDFQGHYTKLSIDDVNGQLRIRDYKAPCNLQLAHERDKQISSRIRSFYVDERALQEGYDDVEIMRKDPVRSSAVMQVFDYIDQAKASGLQKKGLYLQGPFGTGKTFLMCYLLHELAKEGHSGVIVYMPDFVEDVKSMIQDGEKLRDTIELMKNTDLLIFDDIGAENMGPWVRDHVLGSILNHRMNRKPTFYTSNYSLSDLSKHLSFTNKDGEEAYKGERLMNRIQPFVETIHVLGENKRG